MNYRIKESFISYFSNELSQPLSGRQIITISAECAIKHGIEVPYNSVPHMKAKRDFLYANLSKLNEGLEISTMIEVLKTFINTLPELSEIRKNVSMQLIKNYGSYITSESDEIAHTIEETRHWLSFYPDALTLYESAVEKYNTGVYQRNTLDDLRLSLETLVRNILSTSKTLENSIPLVGDYLKVSDVTVYFRNMITSLITYYTNFQNDKVKHHNDPIEKVELDYVLSFTGLIMQLLIKVGKDDE